MKSFLLTLFVLTFIGSIYGINAAPTDLKNTAKQVQLVPYNGKIDNIFFHPLIAWTDKAFSTDKKAFEYIDTWFCTVNEFKAILQQMYDRNYVLVDIYDTVDRETLKPKTLLLPVGKKPFILSVDDFNYYDTMKLKGTNHLMMLDKDGNVVTYTKQPDGTEVYSKDNEVPTVLENFIKLHPDFSINGARGIIAFTGYHGLFGYRIQNPQLPDIATVKSNIKLLADKLKSMGWRFASHSWSHQQQNAIDEVKFEAQETRWINDETPLLGPVDLYITPFGSPLEPYKERIKWLYSKGFHFFFNVGYDSSWTYNSEGVHMDRIPIDGRGLRGHNSVLNKLFDVKAVLDPARPEIKAVTAKVTPTPTPPPKQF